MASSKLRCQYVKIKEFPDSSFDITSKINPIYNTSVDRTRSGLPTIFNAQKARSRAHKQLFDVLRSNEWQWFITLTFGDDERLSDDFVRDKFAQWRKMVRKQFPDMFYVAVPEYHKKGGLHLHLVVGGVSAADLRLKHSGRVLHKGKAWRKKDFVRAGFCEDTLTGEGAVIYNVSSWDGYGWSTATEIRNNEAVQRYVSKYITKTNIDPRFYNKRHFFCSHNVNRPKVYTDNTKFINYLHDEYTDIFTVHFGDLRYKYRQYDTVCKEDIIRQRLAKLRL